MLDMKMQAKTNYARKYLLDRRICTHSYYRTVYNDWNQMYVVLYRVAQKSKPL